MLQHQPELDHKNHISHYKNVSKSRRARNAAAACACAWAWSGGNQFQVPRLPSGWTMARCCCYKIWFYEPSASLPLIGAGKRRSKFESRLRSRLRTEGEGRTAAAAADSLSSVPFDGQLTMILMFFMTGT